VKFAEVVSIIEGQILGEADPDLEIKCGSASDLMSDVLAFTEAGSVLFTGLTNPQSVRTAEMADIKAIVFVRGKQPPQETIELAREKGIPLAATSLPMFEVCGRLYEAGLRSCDISCQVKWDRG
jgi:predicted transcriptional regulator